jgi:trehalose-6-phosphate synthase
VADLPLPAGYGRVLTAWSLRLYAAQSAFGGRIAQNIAPDDIVWVNSIGLFHHIPFPPPEMLTTVPNHERRIPAMYHYDQIGFQTDRDALNFRTIWRTNATQVVSQAHFAR